MKNGNVIVKQDCHSRVFLSGIFRVLSRYAHKENTLFINNSYIEDPRLQISGMTALYNNGFTLIELLVVVLIIGILAAVAVPQYQKAVIKSQLSQLKSLATGVSRAAELYYLAKGSYPSSLQEMTLDFPAPTSIRIMKGHYEAYFYPWGFCYLQYDSSANVTCYDSRAQISYTYFFDFTSDYAGEKRCGGIIDSIAEKVCQQETGKTSPVYTGTMWDFTEKIHSYKY